MDVALFDIIIFAWFISHTSQSNACTHINHFSCYIYNVSMWNDVWIIWQDSFRNRTECVYGFCNFHYQQWFNIIALKQLHLQFLNGGISL